MRGELYIGVVGAGTEDVELLPVAEEVGRLIAEENAVLVCGGLGGVMNAAARGAKLAGGRTVGLLPGDSRAEGNDHLDIAIATGMDEMRNVLIARATDGLIAVGGGHGTLSEIAFALKLGKPVVGLRTWTDIEGITEAGSPSEAVRSLLSLLRGP